MDPGGDIMDKKKILLISMRYPPAIGGIQTYTQQIAAHLSRHYEVHRMVNRHGEWMSVPFALASSFRALARSRAATYDCLLLTEATLAPLGCMLKHAFGCPVVITVHGLDITLGNAVYQKLIPRCVNRLHHVVCVSEYTANECRARGIDPRKTSVIFSGTDPVDFQSVRPMVDHLEHKTGISLRNKKIVLSVGRLIKRKGFDWFVTHVVDQLPEEFVYVLVGDGPCRRSIQAQIARAGRKQRVRLLGFVDQETLQQLYLTAQVLVMPNQKTNHDPEGFGLVAIEAASHGLPVVANDIDGISNAVVNGKTGWLVRCNEVASFVRRITLPELARPDVVAASRAFLWDRPVEQYRAIIDGLTSHRPNGQRPC